MKRTRRQRAAEVTGILDVARDLVELGDLLEAEALLCDELPNRHDNNCPACGAMGSREAVEGVHSGWKAARCRESALVTCRACSGNGMRAFRQQRRETDDARFTVDWVDVVEPCHECYGTGQREQWVDMVVPHESRLIARRKP